MLLSSSKLQNLSLGTAGTKFYSFDLCSGPCSTLSDCAGRVEDLPPTITVEIKVPPCVSNLRKKKKNFEVVHSLVSWCPCSCIKGFRSIWLNSSHVSHSKSSIRGTVFLTGAMVYMNFAAKMGLSTNSRDNL